MDNKSNVVNLFSERWVQSVFAESGLKVDVSSKGNVRFNVEGGAAVLSMEQMARLGEALSIAYREEDDG